MHSGRDVWPTSRQTRENLFLKKKKGKVEHTRCVSFLCLIFDLETTLSGLVECGSCGGSGGCLCGLLNSSVRHDSCGKLLTSFVDGEPGSSERIST